MKQKESLMIRSLGDYLGRDVAEVVGELVRKADYSEFKLAEAIGKDVNETRNLLYKLHSASLASFIKKKDHKIGWYIYYWTFHDDRVAAFLLAEKKAELELLRERVSRENKSSFFSCANKCVSIDFDRAFEFSFHCPECGGLLGQENSGARIGGWEQEITLLERDIRALKAAVEKEEAKRRESTLSSA